MAEAGRGLNFDCPNCASRLGVTQVDWSAYRNGLKRRRVCPNCNYRCTTIETVVPSEELHRFGRTPK